MRRDLDDSDDEPQVRAGGGVLLRATSTGAPEVAIIHRPKYDDWSLPKGKLDPGESWEEAAVREVAEETGLTASLGEELPPVRYEDRQGRDKLVRYWAMEATGGSFAVNDEVDELRWLAPDAAVELLAYPHDRELVRAAVAAFTG